jgi:hypothetical protein
MKFLQILVLILGLAIFVNAQKTLLNGILADETGAVISNTKVTATSNDRRTYQVWTNEYGVYRLEIPFGIYSIEFEAVGFKIYKIEKYKIASSTKGKMSLDIVLEVRDCNDPLVNCDFITGEPLKNKKKSNKLIKKKGNNK